MRAVDELWLICGESTDTISSMTIPELVFWHGRSVGFFSKGGRPAPRSAVAAEQVRQIEHYVKGFRA